MQVINTTTDNSFDKAKTFNIYIDESCYLEHDHFPLMCIGYIKIEADHYLSLKKRIKEIKVNYKSPTEIKWNHLSNSRMGLYKELVEFFFANDMEFRCILVKNKDKLNHKDYNQGSHDNYYYKLIYYLLGFSTNPPTNNYRVFLDIKDTRGKERLETICSVFDNKYHGNSPFKHFQHIHSAENEFIQLTDLFIGAITYKSKQNHIQGHTSKAKQELITFIESKSGYSLDRGTEPWETKFNIFDHQPKSFR